MRQAGRRRGDGYVYIHPPTGQRKDFAFADLSIEGNYTILTKFLEWLHE